MKEDVSKAARPMRVLWLSNLAQTDSDCAGSGTWLGATARGLLASGQVTLGNIALGAVSGVIRKDAGAIQQWLVPVDQTWKGGLPGSSVLDGIIAAVRDFQPDLVHVWGAEYFWGLLTAGKIIDVPAILEMQGLRSAIAGVYTAGLSFRDVVGCVGVREIVRCETLWQQAKRSADWGGVEKEILRGHRFITAQSDWLEARVRVAAPNCRIFRNDFILRKEFLDSPAWHDQGGCSLFCSGSLKSSIKGLHVAIRAVSFLKDEFPDITLRIAGPWQKPFQKEGLKRDGYVHWLDGLARELGVTSNIRWLGKLDAPHLIEELLGCSAAIFPTFIEGYCLALAEAMVVGTPVVASFVGGIPSLAVDGESALLFPAADVEMFAHQIRRLLLDRDLADRLSRRAREIGLNRNNPDRIIKKQLEIYRIVLRDW